jgi:excisionase family DNA binding protein
MSLELLTVNDLCKRLKLSRNKINELIRNKKIESLKLDKSRRFTEQQIDKYLSSVIDENSSTDI